MTTHARGHNQTSLFEPSTPDTPYREIPVREPLSPFARNSETSRQAAIAQVRKLPRVQREYYEALQKHKGLTDHEAAAILGRPLSSINGRRNELMRQGKVRDSGRVKPGPYGTDCTIWEAVS